MLRNFYILLTLIFLLSCQSVEKNKSELSGKELFRQNCVLCHGIKGDLMTNGAKNLSLSELAIEERILVIKNGRNIMTGFADRLSDEQIKKIAEFTLSLKIN